MTRDGHKNREAGVSLIIVLGLLSVLTVLAIAFSRSMREGRLTSRSYADQVRAEGLAEAALVRAMEDVDASLQGYTYPLWPSADDAMASTSSPTALSCDLLSGEAADFVPRALWHDASLANQNCRWRDIVTSDATRTNGRIAYLVVNCSGLLDVNTSGGQSRNDGLSPSEIDYYALPDLSNGTAAFFSKRSSDLRYETIAELAAVNGNVLTPVSNLFVYSYDPNRDEYFTNTLALGQRGVVFPTKFPVNYSRFFGTSNDYYGYSSDTNFMGSYFRFLTNLLVTAGFPDARETAWNLVNYIDGDHIPQTDAVYPWLDNCGVEAVPAITKVALQKVDGLSSNIYEFVVGLWYPFIPDLTTNKFILQVAAVFPNDLGDTVCLSPTNLMAAASPTNWSFATNIGSMTFGGVNSEYLCFTSPVDRRISFPDATGTNYEPITLHPIWFLARIVDAASGLPVDQAMTSNQCYRFADTNCLWVADPFDNSRDSGWSNTVPSWRSAGNEDVPICVRDNAMETIGELGHIRRGSPPEPVLSSVDILSTNGAKLLDRMTVRLTPSPTRGLVSISSRQPDVLRALWEGLPLGFTNSVVTDRPFITYETNAILIDSLVQTLITNGTYRCFEALVEPDEYGNAAVSNALAAFQTVGGNNDIVREDPLRGITELVTFRQNLFTIIFAAQAVGADGATPVAEKRGVAVVFRDAYTGRYFTRFQKWITR